MHAKPADAAVPRRRRLVWLIGIAAPLCLQLAFDLVKEAPIGAFGYDLLRRGCDQSRLAHPQRIARTTRLVATGYFRM
jgi:hypothetical protein